MRKLHTFAEEALASRFTAVLTVNKIEAEVLRNKENGWDLWIIDDDALKTADELLDRFQYNPHADEFENAFTQAKKIHEQLRQEKADRIKRAKTIQVRTQFRDPQSMAMAMQRKNTFTRKIIMLCAVVFGASLVFDKTNDPNGGGNFVRNALQVHDWSNTRRGELVDGELVEYSDLERNFQHIGKGQFWRLITPVFVHGTGQEFLFDFLHIFFNMYWMYWLGTRLEVQFGLKAYLGLFLVSGIVSILVPLLTPNTGLLGIRGLGGGPVVGMSGVVYGIVGFGWCKMKMKPSVGVLVTPFVLIFAVGWMLMGIAAGSASQEAGFINSISHLAHLAGLIAGVAYAFVHTKLGK